MASPWLLLLSAIAIYFFWRIILYPIFVSYSNPIPGPPRPSLLFGHAMEIFSAPPLALHLQWAMEFKTPIVRYWMSASDKILLCDPALVQHVLNDSVTFSKDLFDYTVLGDTVGDSILTTADAKVHHRLRSLCNVAFKYSNVRLFSDLFRDQSIRTIEFLDSKIGTNVDISKLMCALTLDIIGLSSFDCDFQSLYHQDDGLSGKYLDLMSTFEPSLMYLLPYGSKMPFARNKKRWALLKEIKQYVLAIIKQKREKKSNSDTTTQTGHVDLLSFLIDATEDGQKKLNDEELIELCLTFLIAGHETTSQLLCWTLYSLAQHPEIADRCVEEIQSSIGEGDDSLPYLSNVIRESLRLNAPVPFVKRKCEKDVKLGDYNVAKGTELVISPLVIHRLPWLWENPMEFNPSRWETEKDISHKFLPFLSGTRNCIGWRFALLEAKTILMTLLPKFRFQNSELFPIIPKLRITLRPFPALVMTVMAR